MSQIFNWSDWGLRSAFALIFWIPFGLSLFMRERPTRAGLHVLIWGMMWLPEAAAFDFPLLPPLSKYSLSALCGLLGIYLWGKSRLRAARFGRGYDLVAFLMMLGEVGTVITNQDPLTYGSWTSIHLPAFTAYDGLSAAVRDFLELCLPLVLGRALVRSRKDLTEMMQIFVVAGLVYSLPILYELRMSPMLHQNIYGFQPRTDWSQNLRLGGYRPTVFMGHGLVVGFFMFLSTISAVALHKAGKRRLWGSVPMGFVVGYLFVMLVLVKATAALLYAAAGFALIRFVSVKNQLRVCALLALIVVSYPFSRLTDVFPTQALLSAAGTFGADRVQSMQFRFDNEDILVLKGMERPVFGWGGFARERVYDADTGKDLVVQDGAWILLFGTHGILGFLCYYFILLMPIFATARRYRRVRDPVERSLLASLCFIVVVCAVNTLPNMSLPNLQFFFAAALATLLEELPKQAAQTAKAQQHAAAEAAAVSSPPIGGVPHVQ